MASDRPRRPARMSGQWPALALAIAVHVGFIAVLVFSLRWQNRKPEPVTVELYAPPSRMAVAEPVAAPPPKPEPVPEPKVVPEPRLAPAPKAEAPPKKLAPKPEPKVEKPDPRAAEIAQKARQDEAERKKREQAAREKSEREKKEAEQRETEKKKQDEQRRLAEARERQKREAETLERQKRDTETLERQTREADALRAQAEREQATRAAQQKADAETAARNRAEADYIRRIQAKVKGNVVLPPDMPGTPEAIFDVIQLPTGEIIDTVLRKSSGIRAYDDAVQRAIVKSSPLPRPDRPDLFQRTLTLKFRPQD